MTDTKKPPLSSRERSALASKRAKKHPWHVWHVWHSNGFQEEPNPNRRNWKFGGQK